MTVRARSLRTRLLWGTLLIIAVVMTAVMLVVEHRQRTAIVDEVQRRGEVLARGLAATAQAPLLLYDFTALEQNVAQAAAEDDVPYAIVLDADGRVAAHSERPERVGMLLHGGLDRRAVDATGPLVQETTTDTGEGIYDFAVPIVVGHQKWGTARIGVSKQRMERLIRRTRWELGALTAAMLLLGGLAAALVARRISRPVQQLAAGAAAVSRGELDLQDRAHHRRRDRRTGSGLQSHDRAAPAAARRARGRQLRAAAPPRGAGRSQELHRQRPGLDDQRPDHRRSRRTRGHAQSGRRADDRLLRRRGDGPLLHRRLRRHAPARRDPHGDDRQPHRLPGPGRHRAPAQRPDAVGRDQRGAAQGWRGQGPRRDRGDARSHGRARAGDPAASLRPAGRAGQPGRRPRPRDQEPADVAADLQPAPHAALRRRAVPREVPVGRPARAAAHQRHRRAAARAGPALAPDLRGGPAARCCWSAWWTCARTSWTAAASA